MNNNSANDEVDLAFSNAVQRLIKDFALGSRCEEYVRSRLIHMVNIVQRTRETPLRIYRDDGADMGDTFSTSPLPLREAIAKAEWVLRMPYNVVNNTPKVQKQVTTSPQKNEDAEARLSPPPAPPPSPAGSPRAQPQPPRKAAVAGRMAMRPPRRQQKPLVPPPAPPVPPRGQLGHGSFSRSPVNREGALTLRSTPSLPHMPSHADTAGQLHVALPPFGPAPPPHARDKLHEEYSARVALHCRVSTTPETSCHGRRDHYTANLSLPHLGDDDGQPVCKRAHVTADEPASKSSGGGFQAQTTHSTLLVHSHKLPCMPVTWELDPQQLHPAQREDWLKDRAQAPTTAVSPSHRATSTARSTSKPQTGKTPAAREAASTRERCRRGAISTQIDTMRALVFEPSGKRHSELTVLICALYTLYKRDSHFRMSPEQSYHGALLTQQDVTDAAMLEIVNSERQRKKLPPVASLGHFTYPRSASPSAPERVEEEPCTTASRKMVARVARGGATMPVDAPLLDASSCEEQQSVQDTQQAAASQSSTRNSRKNNQERKSRSLKAQVICKMASLLPSATTREKQLEATCERLRFLQRPEKRQGKLDPSEMSNFLRLLCDRDTTPYKQHN